MTTALNFPNSVQTWDWPASGNDVYAGFFSFANFQQGTSLTEGIKTKVKKKLKANVDYKLSFYAFTASKHAAVQNATHKQYVVLRLYNDSQSFDIGGNYHILPNYTQVTGNNNWAYFETTFSLPSNLSSVFDSLEIRALYEYNGTVLKPSSFIDYDIYSFIDDVKLEADDPKGGLPIVMYVDSIKYPNWDDCPYAPFVKTDANGDLYMAMMSCENTLTPGNTFDYDLHNGNWPPIPVATRSLVIMKIGQSCGRTIEWVKKIDAQPYIGPGGLTEFTAFHLNGMEVSDDGHIYLAGSSSRGSLDFGNNITTTVPPSSGGSINNTDIWTAIFDPSGNCLDAKTFGDGQGAQLVHDLALNESNDQLILTGQNNDFSQLWKIFGNANAEPGGGDNFLMTWDVSTNLLVNDVPKDLNGKAAEHIAAEGDDLYFYVYENLGGGLFKHYLEKYDIPSLSFSSTASLTSSDIIPSPAQAIGVSDIHAVGGKLFVSANTSGTVKLAGSGSSSSQQAVSTVKNLNGFTLSAGFIARYDDLLNFEDRYICEAASDVNGFTIHPDLYYSNVSSVAGKLAGNSQGEVVMTLTTWDVEINSQRYFTDNSNMAAIKFGAFLDPVWYNPTPGDKAWQYGDLCINRNDETDFYTAYYARPNFQQFDGDPVDVPSNTFSLFVQNIEDLGSTSYFKVLADTEMYVDKKGFSLYPNPAKGDVMVSCSSGYIVSVAITDMSGKTIRTQEYDGEKPKQLVSTTGVSPGAYLVHIQAKGTSAIRRLLVQ